MSFRKITAAVLLAALPLFGAVSLPAHAAKADLKLLDPDSDGTVSLDEAKAAAAKKFDALDPDKDGTLDKKEAKGLMSASTFKKADPDKDGTVDKAEYTAEVEAAFAKADPDKDGTLDAKELATPAGKALVALIQ